MQKGKQSNYNIALWDNIQNASDLSKFTANLGITSMVKNVNNDPAFRSRIKKVPEFLANRKFFWANALESQMNAFFSNRKINLSGNYIIMRADMIPSAYDPYRAYDKLSAKVRGKLGFRGTVDKDKWNPSDVWIFTKKSQDFLTKFITLFNNQILKLGDDVGKVLFNSNRSIFTKTKMNFSIFLPPKDNGEKVPALIYLAGLTCTDETFMIKSGAQEYASKHRIAIILSLIHISEPTRLLSIGDGGVGV